MASRALQPDRALLTRTDQDSSRHIASDQVKIITEPVRTADIEPLMDAITQKYREYPGMCAFAARGSIISSNDGGTRSINLDISGPNLATIYDVALAAYRRAGEVFEDPRIQPARWSSTCAVKSPALQATGDAAIGFIPVATGRVNSYPLIEARVGRLVRSRELRITTRPRRATRQTLATRASGV